jgi:hypothetical protein
MRPTLGVLVYLVASTAAGVSNAQQPTPPATPPNSPPEIIAPRQDDSAGKASGGVVQPPNVDPGIDIKPPANTRQSMPIIPPPGAPGGNPQVVPK